MKPSPNPNTTSDRAALGRESHERGHSFEDDVASIYRLLNYKVQHGRIFHGRQVDIFLERKLGDFRIYRAIECKAGPVKAEHVDAMLLKLRLVRKDYPSAAGTIVSGKGFTDAVTSHASAEGIQLTLFQDLQGELFDGVTYAEAIKRECETDETYTLSSYIEPQVSHDTGTTKALRVLTEWLDDKSWQQLTLLGDVGTGKTFLTRVLTYRLANIYLEDPLRHPLPIRIDLRNADRQFTLEGLILSHLSKYGLDEMSFPVFRHASALGRIVLIFDGFDEMSARVTSQVTRKNFEELARAVVKNSKVLLTCRTHYFRSRSEAEEQVLGPARGYESDSARELYWDLISRRGFKIAYLKAFKIEQITAYVKLVRPSDSHEVLRKIKTIYNLMELCSRPLLLDMIVKSVDKIGRSDIDPAGLYRVFTDAWIHRDKWREVLSPEEKIDFLSGLARSLWAEQASVIHHSVLADYVSAELADRIRNPRDMAEVDHEIRTASFLVRDDDGHYGFAHKSYKEYFFSKHLASRLIESRINCLKTPRISPEVCGFTADILARDGNNQTGEYPLIRALEEHYREGITENALLCLYEIRRRPIEKGDSKRVEFPTDMDLSGAQLNQVDLSGSVMTRAKFRGADLSEAQLSNMDLRDSDLTNALLANASISATNLQGSMLKGTSFEDADLTGAILDRTKVDGAIFTGASVDETTTVGVDLSLAVDYGELDLLSEDEIWRVLTEDNLRMPKSTARFLLSRAAPMADFDSEDLVQETLLWFIQKDRSLEFQSKANVQRFVSTVMERKLSDLRRRRLFRYKMEGSGYMEVNTVDPGFDSQAEATDFLKKVGSLLEKELSEQALQVFMMQLQGHSYEEISRKLGITRSRVYRLMKAARAHVRRMGL